MSDEPFILIAETQPNFTAKAVGTTGIASTSNFITLRSYIVTTEVDTHERTDDFAVLITERFR